MGHLSNVDRHRALCMVDNGLSYRQVAECMGCLHTTIARLVERHNSTGSVEDRQRPGRESVTTCQQDQYIVLSHLRDRFRTSLETVKETVGTHNLCVSALTVRQRLQECGISSHKTYRGNVLTAERRISRFNWCRQHTRWTQQYWRGVLFMDEFRFCVEMFDKRRKVWRRHGERFQDCCVKQVSRWGGGSIMVWGGISWHHKTQLVVDGNLMACWYIDEILEPEVVPFLRNNDDVMLFQQDNAHAHSARLTMDFFNQNGVQVLPWPAF